MVDAHSRNIGNGNKLDMPSFRFTAGQLKAEVKKRHFLISFFPDKFQLR